MSDDTTIEERIAELKKAERLTGAPELREKEREAREKRLDEAMKLRVAEGKGGDVIRGRFVEVIEREDTQWVILDPNDGRPQVRLESPGFNDIYQRSAPEIAKAYEEREHTYVNEEAARVEARALISPRGNVVWDVQGVDRGALRFNPSCALSPDGSVLATLYETDKEECIVVYDAFTGEKRFDARTRRRSGSRTLSVAPGGEAIALVFGDLRSTVLAWSGDGTLVFEGQVPFRSQSAAIHDGRFVAAEHWVIRLVE